MITSDKPTVTPHDSIEICGITVPVVVAPLANAHGEFCPVARTITIDPAVLESWELYTTTVAHEVFHGVLDFTGFGSNTSGRIGAQLEEQLVVVLTNIGLPAILQIYNA